MRQESILMKLFLKMGMDSIAWSLRRVYVPVARSALVLEVGSGANPYFRSNVLLDAYESTQERHWTPLIKDRPTVLGFVENLPFQDKSFDFIIASHVLEHSADPESFLKELIRVGKAGYIEVPHAFAERISSYFDHRLELLVDNNKLKIWKKKDWLIDKQLMSYFMNKPVEVFSPRLLSKKPFHFHVRLYWENVIDFEVMNPEIDASWKSPESSHHWEYDHLSLVGKFKSSFLKLIRTFFSQKRRNQKINLLALTRCPFCHSEARLEKIEQKIICKSCKREFRHSDGFIDLITPIK